MTLGHTQTNILEALDSGPRYTGRCAVDGISEEAAHKSLRRLEDRGLVRRVGIRTRNREIQWELTEAGREALDAASVV